MKNILIASLLLASSPFAGASEAPVDDRQLEQMMERRAQEKAEAEAKATADARANGAYWLENAEEGANCPDHGHQPDCCKRHQHSRIPPAPESGRRPSEVSLEAAYLYLNNEPAYTESFGFQGGLTFQSPAGLSIGIDLARVSVHPKDGPRLPGWENTIFFRLGWDVHFSDRHAMYLDLGRSTGSDLNSTAFGTGYTYENPILELTIGPRYVRQQVRQGRDLSLDTVSLESRLMFNIGPGAYFPLRMGLYGSAGRSAVSDGVAMDEGSGNYALAFVTEYRFRH